MSFEITTEEEYIALVTCVSLYVMYKQITFEKTDIEKEEMMTFCDLYEIKLRKVEQFLRKKKKMKKPILLSLQVAMHVGILIQKKLRDNRFDLGQNVVIAYCQEYQDVYTDWLNAIQEYEKKHTIGLEEIEENRCSKIPYILLVLGFIGISTCLAMKGFNCDFIKSIYEKEERILKYGDTSFEDMEVEMILARKL